MGGGGGTHTLVGGGGTVMLGLFLVKYLLSQFWERSRGGTCALAYLLKLKFSPKNKYTRDRCRDVSFHCLSRLGSLGVYSIRTRFPEKMVK